MFVIEVIPLMRGTRIDTLSYYSAENYSLGTILSVPIRGKAQRAIVTNIHSVTDAKTALRNAAFTLKKLPPQKSISVVPENVRATAAALTKIYPSTTGAILFQLLAPEVRDGNYLYPNISTLVHNEESIPKVLTATASERYVAYRSHIRSVLARRGSVLFVAPTSADIEIARSKLTQGIEDRIVVFSPNQSTKERTAAYAAYEDTSIAKVILTTPGHAYLDRVDLLSIIIEKEASEFYRSRLRPYLDHRIALSTLASNTGRSILLGDVLPRPEVEQARRADFYTTEGADTKRIAFPAPLSIIIQKDKPTAENPFSLFSKELHKHITSTLEGRGRVFLYGARRGIAPVVACVDCGHIFRCPDSGTPYSLLRTHNSDGTESRWFISSVSGKRLRAADTCPTCTSWRLRERGIGIQAVFDETVANFPHHTVLLFDYLTASTNKRALAIIKEFYAARAIILVGTQITLPYLSDTGVDLTAVMSLDAVRANPTWRADESVLRLLFELREFSHKSVILQTRTTPDQLLEVAKNGQIEGFYNEELALRETLLYPPFATFILLSFEGEKAVVEKIELEIKKRTQSWDGSYYSSPLSTGTKTLRHALFRLKIKDPTRVDLIEIIRSFPPYIKIEIDPNRIV